VTEVFVNNIKNVIFPETLKDAVSALKKKKSFFMSSSTFSFKSVPEGTENIVLAKKLPLRYVKKDPKNLLIGALTTFDDLENNPLCRSLFSGILSFSASRCSSQLIRNMATVGGNIAHPNAFNLLPVVLTALGASVKVALRTGSKTVPVRDFYSSKFKCGTEAIITEIQAPLSLAKDDFYFEKVSKIRSSWDSYITVAFRSRLRNGRLEDLKLAFGAITAFPYVNEALEKELLGAELTPALIKSVSAKYGEAVLAFHPASRINAYRAELAANLTAFYLKGLTEKV